MKILHTSDWHIGKIVNEYSMIKDQEYILNELLQVVKNENIDVVVIAGDIYDRSIPPTEAVDLLDEVLSDLIVNQKVKVLAISGNHDSGERIGFASKILQKQGLHMVGSYEELYRKVTLIENNQNINFYLVPYKDPAVIKKLIDDSSIKNHNDANEAVVNLIKKELNTNEINILVGHGYVTMKREEAIECENMENMYESAHLEVSQSERPLSIGGTDLIDGKIYEDFDYVALGHLHKRQKIGRETMNYSGSLLKYSFSEANNKNGVKIITINDKDVDVDFKELKPLRDLRVIKGSLEDLLNEGRDLEQGKDDYIQAILTDEGALINPMESLKQVYKNAMLITREKRKEHDNENKAAKGEYKSKTKLELFEDFYKDLGSGEYDKEKEKVLIDVINTVLKEEK